MPTHARRAARIVLFDAQDRVLLFQYRRADGRRFWATPGGGLEPGETFEAAAARELEEELGLALPLHRGWSATSTFPMQGRFVFQEEQFFLGRVAHYQVPRDLEDVHEAEAIVATRWWMLEELETASRSESDDEPIYPNELARHVRVWMGRMGELPPMETEPPPPSPRSSRA